MGSAESPARHLTWDGCANVRDLGGYATADGGQTRWRAVVRADSLCGLTSAGRAALIAYSVRTIIDLRDPHELAEAPHPFARQTAPDAAPIYLHRPLEDWTDAVYQAAIQAGAATGTSYYIIILDHYRARVAGIMRAIAHAPAGGVLIHCTAGKDRAGIIAALLLALAGVPAATIAADYALSDICLRPRYEALARQAQDEAERARLAAPKAPPERMLAMLAWLDRQHRGVRSYLLHAGVTEAEIERIRARLRA